MTGEIIENRRESKLLGSKSGQLIHRQHKAKLEVYYLVNYQAEESTEYLLASNTKYW